MIKGNGTQAEVRKALEETKAAFETICNRNELNKQDRMYFLWVLTDFDIVLGESDRARQRDLTDLLDIASQRDALQAKLEKTEAERDAALAEVASCGRFLDAVMPELKKVKAERDALQAKLDQIESDKAAKKLSDIDGKKLSGISSPTGRDSFNTALDRLAKSMKRYGEWLDRSGNA